MIIFKLPLPDSCHVHQGMPQICHNFTKIGVGHQGLPDPYSSASVSIDKGWQSLPLDTLALLAGLIGLMVMQATEVGKNKSWVSKDANQE